VAAVPAVQYPCQVATAPDGSLFVAEDPMDQVGPADKPIDRILLFRDGRDPVVFAEKLNAAFGMAWRDGALYVMNMPHLTVLRDTDGDGKSDRREELFTDLGVPAGQPNMFNDHIVSGLQFGVDGYLYIAVGDKGVPKATGRDGRTATVRGGGVLRCRPDGTGLEVFTTGTRNHLEPNLDARDNLFTYDNTDDGLGWWTRVTHHVDGGYYGYPWDYHLRTDRMLGRMAEYGGGSPCGGVVYKEDVWPEPYRGRAFWAEWGKRVVRAFRFEPDGASFKVADVIDFVQPDGLSDFRPLDLALSHDGRTLYIADWGYGGWNNKTEKLGRVYAVTYRGEVKTRPRGKDSDPIGSQIRQLDHPSYNERLRAQLALTRECKTALGPLRDALVDPKTDAVAKRHLIWALDAIAGATPEATFPLLEALTDPSADVRAQAARALGERGAPVAVEPLARLLKDAEPSVRLQAVIALGRTGSSEAVASLVSTVADPDPYLAYSARTALRRIGDWRAAAAGLDSGEPKVQAGVMLAMEAVDDTDAAGALARFAAEPKRDPVLRARAVFLLSQGHRKPRPWDGKWWGTQPANSKRPARTVDWPGTPLVLEAVRGRLGDPESVVRKAAVAAVVDEGDAEALPQLRARFAAEPVGAVRREIARAFGALKDRAALPLLADVLRDRQADPAVREEALASVEAIGDDAALRLLLDLLESSALGADKQPRVISALGRFRSSRAVDALLKALERPDPSVRAAAAEALGTAGSSVDVAGPLRGRLTDPAVEVRNAAAGALGVLKDRDSVPALVGSAGEPSTRFEATLALTRMPDPRALPAYLRGLTDKSPDLRRASSRALAAVRDDAAPVLERLAERKELPSTALPELRRIYTRTRPLQRWHLIGPFPIEAEPPFPTGAAVDLKATYPGFQDRPFAWRSARPVDFQGQIDVGKVLGHDDDRAAFGYAVVESPTERKAEFAVGSDDTLTVWVNGEKVYDFQDRRGFSPGESRFDAPLVKGTNRVLVKCGNRGGSWQFSVAVAYPSDHAFLKGLAPGAFDPEAFRTFAQSAAGRPERGKALFQDLKGLACVKCHTVGGQGGTVGPELTSVGAKYPRDELIVSVLYPSAKISSGYEPVVLATDDGRVLTGIVKAEDPAAVEIEDADAKRVKVPKDRIEERKRGDVSLMPNGLADGLSREDFADLIAYLETLKDKDPAPGAGPR
jgi:putative membrane-bound dehydrogenase-like protein